MTTERDRNNSGLPEDLVEKYRHSGDPLADAVVAEAERFGGLGELQLLLNSIINVSVIAHPDGYDDLVGHERPAYRSYFERSVQVPGLFYERCQAPDRLVSEWFNEYGWTAFSILGCAALPEGYSVPEVARALAMTQEIEVHVRKRLYESVQFLIDVMDPEGILVDTGAGVVGSVTLSGVAVDRARKVRLFHAIIRRLLVMQLGDDTGPVDVEPYGEMLLRHEWPTEYGTPINQAQMGGTILSFSHTLLWGLETLGYNVETEMQDAYLARWNLIGYVMGLDPELMRWQYPSAKQLYEHLRRPGGEPEDSARLTAALVGFMEETVPWWLGFLRPVASMLMVHLIGEQRAAEAGLELSPARRRFMPVLRGAMSLWARLISRSDPMRWLSGWLYVQMRRKVIGGNKPRRFDWGPPNGTPGEKHSFRLRLPESTPSLKGWINRTPL